MENSGTEDKEDIPITVFTGFLGAGKTTLILSLLKKIPKDYRVAMIKNEYGETKVDSQLALQSSIAGVSEILNGCLCCVLVGQMENAILDAIEKFKPNRIIVECSGSAFPGPIAWQISEMKQKGIAVCLDSIVTVVDCENFCGYEDTSYTAQLQAQYSDLILLSKWELVTERQLDNVIDHVNTLNSDTPKIKTSPDTIEPHFVFGIDRKMISIFDKGFLNDLKHMENEVMVKTVSVSSRPTLSSDFTADIIHNALASRLLSKEYFYRIKGYVRLDDGKVYIINWAFGRHGGLLPLLDEQHENELLSRDSCLKLTVMGNDFNSKLSRIFQELLGHDVVIS